MRHDKRAQRIAAPLRPAAIRYLAQNIPQTRARTLRNRHPGHPRNQTHNTLYIIPKTLSSPMTSASLNRPAGRPAVLIIEVDTHSGERRDRAGDGVARGRRASVRRLKFGVETDLAREAGTVAVNDISALAHDPDSLSVVAEAGCQAVIVHSAGDPRTMQDDPRYDDVAPDVYGFLAARVAACEAVGIPCSSV